MIEQIPFNLPQPLAEHLCYTFHSEILAGYQICDFWMTPPSNQNPTILMLLLRSIMLAGQTAFAGICSTTRTNFPKKYTKNTTISLTLTSTSQSPSMTAMTNGILL